MLGDAAEDRSVPSLAGRLPALSFEVGQITS